MGHEIERKFLVRDTQFLHGVTGIPIAQGYLAKNDYATVRVRVAGERAWITVKGRSAGIRRLEYEYLIPLVDAGRMLVELCAAPAVRKTRYAVRHAAHLWDVDVFDGDNKGLVLAEIELQSENEMFERPEWLGEEVSLDFRYANSNLSIRPYCTWGHEYPPELPGIAHARPGRDTRNPCLEVLPR